VRRRPVHPQSQNHAMNTFISRSYFRSLAACLPATEATSGRSNSSAGLSHQERALEKQSQTPRVCNRCTKKASAVVQCMAWDGVASNRRSRPGSRILARVFLFLSTRLLAPVLRDAVFQRSHADTSVHPGYRHPKKNPFATGDPESCFHVRCGLWRNDSER